MKLIKKLAEMIDDELDGAYKYAKCALTYKEDMPDLSRMFNVITTQELEHINMLHTAAVQIIEDYKRTEGKPPEVMMAVYEYLHGKHIEKMAEIKSMQSMLRG